MGGFPENLYGARYFRGCRTDLRSELPTTAKWLHGAYLSTKPSFTRGRSDLASQPLGTLPIFVRFRTSIFNRRGAIVVPR